ncbi:MAG TPA: glycosyltransferase family 2 protein [Candidatus Methylomirabilis sp.]|nr:glycosyltransferase family 2 protein [Candidatus Methylomirabilis sp.]
MKVYAVIPAYHEASRIRGTVEGVRPFVDSVVVVDDGSGDGTAPVARETGATVLRHAINRGQGAALRTGTDAALRLGADVIVHVDADGQHDPALIPTLVQPLTEGRADVVFGSRFMGLLPSDMPWSRRVLLRAARSFNSLVMGIPRRVTDPQSGMRAMTREAALLVDFRQDRMAHCSEILRLVTRSPLRWLEVPIRVRYTSESLAKGQRSADAFKIVWQLLIGGR